jgi:hypothetical protein
MYLLKPPGVTVGEVMSGCSWDAADVLCDADCCPGCVLSTTAVDFTLVQQSAAAVVDCCCGITLHDSNSSRHGAVMKGSMRQPDLPAASAALSAAVLQHTLQLHSVFHQQCAA